MKKYLAKKNNSAIFLSRTEQFDEYLKNGCEIYEIDGDTETKIATPKEGFMIEKPILEIEETGGLLGRGIIE